MYAHSVGQYGCGLPAASSPLLRISVSWIRLTSPLSPTVISLSGPACLPPSGRRWPESRLTTVSPALPPPEAQPVVAAPQLVEQIGHPRVLERARQALGQHLHRPRPRQYRPDPPP